ncbi:MAG: response regulator transcription factor [Streptosporangiaceae bacterium]
MARQRGIYESALSAFAAGPTLTARQVEVLQLAGRGLSSKQIARNLGLSVRTIEDHFSAMRRRTGAHSRSELIAYWAAAGLVKPGLVVPETVISRTAAVSVRSDGETQCRGL